MKQGTQKPHRRVVIVGGGFSGTILTVQLLIRSSIPLSIIVVNRAGKPGRGVAYGTECDEHILNVKAEKMSAIPDDPGHFLRWLQVSGFGTGSDDFAPRWLYGVYMENILQETIKRHPHSQVSWVDGNAISLTLKSDRPLLTLENGNIVEADVAVLATGSAPPLIPPQLRSVARRFFAPYPWAKDALEEIPPLGTVLILGSGLTAVDQVLALGSRNFRGTILLLSRHGRLPAVDSPSLAWSTDWLTTLPANLSSMVACIRQQVELATASGSDVYGVIDSLRPLSAQIWQSLSVADRKKFLRHVRSHWEVARHRIPKKTHDALQQFLRNGRLQILAGRLLQVEVNNDCIEVTFYDRGGSKGRSIAVDRIINCTGPGMVGRLQEPLIHDLLEQGLARLDPTDLGVDTTPDGALTSKSGRVLTSIYGLGPVRKACLWETTSVPEIRVQAVQLADQIVAKLEYDSYI